METINFVLGGLGGQGILFMTKVLANTALKKGFQVMGAETHGMAQRGGSVVSHLRLGGIESSLVKTGSAHFLLALEENEAYRNLPFLKKYGFLFSDSVSKEFPRKEVRPYLEEMHITGHAIPAAKLALDMGIPMSSNLALIGFFSAFQQSPFSADELRQTIDRVSPDRFKKINISVFDKGLEMGQQEI
jgi:indolepyruvate ferredoxin oxidoreductase beta subunit